MNAITYEFCKRAYNVITRENWEEKKDVIRDETKDVLLFLHGVNLMQRKSVRKAATYCLERAEDLKRDGNGWRAEAWEEAGELLRRYSGEKPHGTWWEWLALPEKHCETFGDVRLSWLTFHWGEWGRN